VTRRQLADGQWKLIEPQEEGQPRRQARQPRRRPLQGTKHRRAPDHPTEGLARHRHTLRQDARELPRWPRTSRLNDLARRPLASSRFHDITQALAACQMSSFDQSAGAGREG
jgi:hypothetical protein